MEAELDRASLNRAAQAFLDALTAEPSRYDLLQALRHLDSCYPDLPRLGTAARPADEPLQVVQPADFRFAAAQVGGLLPARRGGRPRLAQRIFGLLGPHGPLPLHLTELARDRAAQQNDPTLQAFFDLLTQRFVLLFYRAWAQAQPVVGLDRPSRPDIARWLGALTGLGEDSQSGRDAAGDRAKLSFSGRLARQVRDADGLLAWCRQEFDVPVRIECWCGHWMPLDAADRSRLRRLGTPALGRGATLGASVWDVQHKFRVVVGPVGLRDYFRFLPGGQELARLQAMVRQWVGLEFAWDLRVILQRDQVPQTRLGGAQAAAGGTAAPLGAPAAAAAAAPALPPLPLGHASWLGRRRRADDAGDLLLDAEHLPPPSPRTLSTPRPEDILS